MTAEKKKRIPKPTITIETSFVLKELLPVLAVDPSNLGDQELFRLILKPAEAALGLRGADDSIEENINNIFTGHDLAFHRETIKGLQDMIRHSSDRREWVREALKWVAPTVDVWNRERQLFTLSPVNYRYERDPQNQQKMIRGWWVFQVAKAFDAQYPGRPSNADFYIGTCGNCQKIFVKSNPKKKWCNDTCRYADGKRQERKRQRSPG